MPFTACRVGGRAGCFHLQRLQYGQAGCVDGQSVSLSTTRSVDRAGCIPLHLHQYTWSWTYRKYSSPPSAFINAEIQNENTVKESFLGNFL